MEQRGQWTLEPGDVLIVPAGEPHRLVEARRPELWGLGFCVPCFAAIRLFQRAHGATPAAWRAAQSLSG